jgi:hypothetical protein
MKLKALLVTAALLAAAPASAGWFDIIQGNDTGGIVPWSPDLRITLPATAAAHCASYHKVALITSYPRQPGDYAGFICAFPRGYDPVRARDGWWW